MTTLFDESFVDKHFPFKAFNPGQREAIVSIVNAFLNGKKHVVADLPTGIGKSAIATTVHRVMREIKKGFRTTIVTATKNLQDQYEQEDAEIVSLKGKTNYTCPQGVGPYNSGKCRQMVAEGNCNKAVICPYVKKRAYWCNIAPLRLTNTSFQVEACPMLVMELENKADLIVIDECHDLDDFLVDHSAMKIKLEDLSSIKKICGKEFLGHFVDFINHFLEYKTGEVVMVEAELSNVGQKLRDLLQGQREYLTAKMKESPTHAKDSFGGAIEELEQFIDKLEIFSSVGGEWILMDYAYGSLLELKPVYAHLVSFRGMFRKADKFLHMSATICGFEQYMYNIGLKVSETACIQADNPIPLKNRQVKNLSVMKVSGDYDKVRLAQFVDKIIKKHGKENGIIHSVSFQLANDIKEYSEFGKRMLISNDRKEILTALGKPNSGTILVSPSVIQGYDFKGDLSRWQIIPKVPFLYLGSHHVSLNMQRHPDWYARKAILKIVQGAGRSVRGVEDYATTYILDSNVDRLLRYNRDIWPEWFLESLS